MIRSALATFSTACRGAVVTFIGVALGLSAAASISAQTGAGTAVVTPKSILSDKAEYHGPERDEPDPSNIEEVRIGFFGPRDSRN
ncbi:hypothetical protein HQ563_01740, partial [bacterium]|nr:hypothetical protein [bacterium]